MCWECYYSYEGLLEAPAFGGDSLYMWTFLNTCDVWRLPRSAGKGSERVFECVVEYFDISFLIFRYCDDFR